MSNTTRNAHLKTSATDVEKNILTAMRCPGFGPRDLWNLSSIGDVGYPGYAFRWPQGAAFAVSKIVRRMISRGLLAYGIDGKYRGYYLTHAGAEAASQKATP